MGLRAPRFWTQSNVAGEPSHSSPSAAVNGLRKAREASAGFARYRNRPAAFAREILGIVLWERQIEIAESVEGHARVAVRSGHKVGKSTIAAVLALWWVCTRSSGRVVMTSSSARQIRTILWKELRRLYRQAKAPIGGQLNKSPDLGLQFDDGREVVGFSTDEPEKMAGVSGAELLFILDEASGIPEAIFEAIEGNRAGGAKIVMFSNPTRTSGTFFDAFHSKRQFWKRLTISSEESPNVAAGKMLFPGLATRDWVEEKRQEWGEDSPLFQVRVRGNFPAQSENAVIGLYLVEEALERWADMPDEGTLYLGVDVARFGDDETVIYPVRGLKALAPKVLTGMDSKQVAGEVLKFSRELRRPGEKPQVKVDVIGIGSGVYDELARNDEVEAIAINVSERATAEGYSKLRDQIWFAVKDWLKDGGGLPSDPKLEAELVAPTYNFDSQGRQKVEAKDAVKARLKRSPDRADGLGLAIYRPPAAAGFGGIPASPMPKRRM